MSTLASIADCKDLLRSTSSGRDALLTRFLEAATDTAQRLVGRSLLRASLTEYPRHTPTFSRYIYLAMCPVEQITSIRQLAVEGGSDSAFAAQAALVEFTDYVLEADTGKLERISGVFYTAARSLQVIYQAGYLDATTQDTLAAWATATAYAAEALVSHAGQVWAAISSHTSELATAPAAGSSLWRAVPTIPPVLRMAVAQEAIRLFRQADMGGASTIQMGQGGGTISTGSISAHPDLVSATDALRRRRVS